MSEKYPAEEYQLVFEGPADNSIETLQKLKGVFIADMDFSIPEVQEILRTAPVTVRRAATENALTSPYLALKGAGGNVYIVKPGEPENGHGEQQHEDNEESENFAVDLEVSGDGSGEIDLDFGDLGTLEEPKAEPVEEKEAEEPCEVEEMLAEPLLSVESERSLEELDSLSFSDKPLDLKAPEAETPKVEALLSRPATEAPGTFLDLTEDLGFGEPHSDIAVEAPKADQPEPAVEAIADLDLSEPKIASDIEELALAFEQAGNLEPAAEQPAPKSEAPKPAAVTGSKAPPALEKTAGLSATDIPDEPLFAFEDDGPAPAAAKPAAPPKKTAPEPAETHEDLAIQFDKSIGGELIEGGLGRADQLEEESIDLNLGMPAPKKDTGKQARQTPAAAADDLTLSVEEHDELNESLADLGESLLDNVLGGMGAEVENELAEPEPAPKAERQVEKRAMPEPEPELQPEPEVEAAPATREKNKAAKAADEGKVSLAEAQKKRSAKQAEEHEEAEDESAAGDDEPVAPQKRRKMKKSGTPWDVLLPIIVGSSVLGLGNWYYFSGGTLSEPDVSPAQVQYEKKVQKKLQAERERAAQKKVLEENASKVISGISENGGISVISRFTSNNGLITGAHIEITTPEPPELTPEEIITNQVRGAWLRKIVVDELRFAQSKKGGFEATGSAKGYLEDSLKKERLKGEATLSGTFDDNKNLIAGTLVLKGGLDAADPGQSFKLAKNDDGTYAFYLSWNLEAAKLEAQQTPPAAAAPAAAKKKK